MKIEIIKYGQKARGIKVLLLIFFFSAIGAVGQQDGLTENDIIVNAGKLYDKKDYHAALPLYAQLVSVNPDDPQFNYRFGVCTLFGDRKDKQKPIKYLNNAAQTMKDDKDLFYHLGLAYHQNQEWSNAMKNYNLYLSKLTPAAPERSTVLEKVNACLNGLNLADKNVISEIISTSKFQKNNFHRAYAAQDFTGSLMLKPDAFITEKEKKSGENSFVYLIHPSNVLYFAGYTNSENSNKDIFKVEMDENGDWRTPERLGETINTSYDEEYPVLVDNGNTLYFCSKGHNSLGGYDIFRSTFDPGLNTFQQPENLGPGINSPFDDIVFIPTKDKSYAYFSSDRDNLNNSINVYKVKLIDNAFNEAFFALNDKVITKKEESSVGNQADQKVSSEMNDQSQNINQQNGVKEPLSDPSKKANLMVSDRSKCMVLTDSAFATIAALKDQVRDLTNKRDRANAISKRKADEAKTLEARLNESIALLANAGNEAEYLLELEKSVKIKEDLYQLQQRSATANKIAWNIGNQIKIKNQEMNDLKTLAGKIQTLSVSSTYEETLLEFSKYKKVVFAADTITDFSEPLMAITNDKTTWVVPASELLFAENLKKAYKNQTLLAELSENKPIIDGNTPIVVVNKRTTAKEEKPPIVTQEKSFEPFPLLQQVNYSKNNIAANDPGQEKLEISFSNDKSIKPLELVQPVYANALASHKNLFEMNLDLSFKVDETVAYKLVDPVEVNLLTKIINVTDENLEILFDIDNNVKAIALVKPVYPSGLNKHDDQFEVNLDLSFKVDKTTAIKLVDPVNMNTIAQNISLAEENIQISESIDKKMVANIPVIISPVYPKGIREFTIVDEMELDINFRIDAIESFKLIEPVLFAAYEKKDNLSDEVIEIIDLTEDKPVFIASNLVSPVILKDNYSGITQIDENLLINFIVDEAKPEIVVQQIVSQVLASNDQIINEPEPESETDQFIAYSLIQPIVYKYIGLITSQKMAEEVELNYGVDRPDFKEYKLVEMIKSKPVLAKVDDDILLDINFIADTKTIEYAVISQIAHAYKSGIADNIMEEDLVISFSNDIEPILVKVEKEVLISETAAVEKKMEPVRVVVEDNQEEVAANENIYYFREAVIKPKGIDTYRSDRELLSKALLSPDELSYEELLYAANLTDVPKEKLAIYNIAFVHIDRDWRAFNNAAVSAIHTSNLSTANCYLYQASLLSEDNGYIKNNMGILASRQNQVDKAQKYFIAASKLGYDAQYNLHLIDGISNIYNSGNMDDQKNFHNSDKNEDVVVDIINYQATEE